MYRTNCYNIYSIV